MTNSPNSVTSKELISVVMFSTGSRELTLTNLKQLLSLKPEHWQLEVHLVTEHANEATLKLIHSLGLQVSIIEGAGKITSSRLLAKVMQKLSPDSGAVLWLAADTNFKSDAYVQIHNFHKQYPSAILVGQFQDEATSQISAGGYSGSGFNLGKKNRMQAQSLPVSVSSFDANLVFVPTSVAKKIGQPTSWLMRVNNHGFYVAAAKRKGIRCLAIPGFLGSFNR